MEVYNIVNASKEFKDSLEELREDMDYGSVSHLKTAFKMAHSRLLASRNQAIENAKKNTANQSTVPNLQSQQSAKSAGNSFEDKLKDIGMAMPVDFTRRNLLE